MNCLFLNIHNMTCTILAFFKKAKYVHILVQTSPLFISRIVFIFPILKLPHSPLPQPWATPSLLSDS